MTESELQKLVESRASDEGLIEVVDRDVSQFLTGLPDCFVELVLTDASRQADAERLIKDVATELERSGMRLDAVVRSLWKVGNIRYVDVARTAEGGIRTALDFRAQLQSGHREIEVRVDVTIAALTILRQKLAKDEFITNFGWSPQRGDVTEANISASVSAFLELQLSHGGTSYWDPLLDKHLLMNEAAMSYVLGHSTAFQELHTAITDAFSPIVSKNFIGGLALSHVSMADFERVLPDLSNILGGAYRRGQRFSVSASELFNSLTRGEQELLRGYFLIQARRAKAEMPQLALEYPSAFANL